ERGVTAAEAGAEEQIPILMLRRQPVKDEAGGDAEDKRAADVDDKGAVRQPSRPRLGGEPIAEPPAGVGAQSAADDEQERLQTIPPKKMISACGLRMENSPHFFFQAQLGGDGLQSVDLELNVLRQIDAEVRRAALDVVAVDVAGEALRFHLLLDARRR